MSNKRSNKKLAICKILTKSILQMITIALLRRWLRVQVWSIQFLFSARFPWAKQLGRQLTLSESEANR
jgi:hypothetical protein